MISRWGIEALGSEELGGWGLRWCELKERVETLRGTGVWKCRGGYLLLLTGHKSLVARGHPKAQLVDDGWLLLAVNLHSDSHLKWGLLCGGTGA